MRISEFYIERWADGERRRTRDLIAVEEPLAIHLTYWFKAQRQSRTVAVTMRTPGEDAELALGFLYTEGIVRAAADVVEICHSGLPPHNEMYVELKPAVEVDWTRLNRHSYANSSCGLCGKTSLDALEQNGLLPPAVERPQMSATLIRGLPQRLQEAQEGFCQTGGLHAAGLFDRSGVLLLSREDVGRHNALDKLIGATISNAVIELPDTVLLMSSRASFEILQKALAAGIAIVAAVGAPSSLAIEFANRFQMTLLGFVRDDRFNIYTGGWRIL